MSCPYLTEVTMAFCAAFPVKKLVPVGKVVTASPCEGEAFGSCPVFREVMARRSEAARRLGMDPESNGAATKGGGS